MPYAENPKDRIRIYFEDDGGKGAAVLLYGGILDSIDLVRISSNARALQEYPDEFRLIYVDHRGLGKSDKPHNEESYAIPLRVADATAVMDELDIDRAHFIGTSYGGRLCFGIGEYAPERVLSLIIGGQQPYSMDRNSPLARAVINGIEASHTEGIEAVVKALEAFSGIRIPNVQRNMYMSNDPAAIEAASNAMVSEGDISKNMGEWQFPCLIFVGENDLDFREKARRAAEEIPNAEFLLVGGADHLGAHVQHDTVTPAILRTLRSAQK